MKAKLWQTSDDGLNGVVEDFTVDDDSIYDQLLLGYDIKASKAHALMLGSVGILTAKNASALAAELDKLYSEWKSGKFVIGQDDEDGHSAIESYLTASLGDVGKKIHAGRSRNDQALIMMRLYLLDQLKIVKVEASKLADAIKAVAAKASGVPMPGYTHTQRAMPSTVADWLGTYAEGIVDVVQLIEATSEIINQNPLGSAAGFGTDLPINPAKTTELLELKKVQSNPQYCGLSRGLFELLALQAVNPLMILFGKFANDMMLFTTEEFGFFSLPDTFTTGSSIMPHKHNYDLFEIMRGKAHAFATYAHQLQSVSVGVGSGYHRDLQLTKKTTVDAFREVSKCIQLMLVVLPELIVHEDKLNQAISPEMLSVSKIDKLVMQGVPFRDAYIKVKQELNLRNNKS